MLYLPNCAGCIASAFGDEPESHGKVEIFRGVCSCEWFNENCPTNVVYIAGRGTRYGPRIGPSCRIEHEPPVHDDDGMWVCPGTDERFAWCDLCGEWNRLSDWDDDPVIIDGQIICAPHEHGYEHCEDCGEYSNGEFDYIEDRWGDEVGYCAECAPSHRPQAPRAPLAARCSTCNTPRIHMDELTEEFVCDCQMAELRRCRKPVLVAAA